ncbi:MAG: hypothetical protein IPN69_16865 [Acidobacteria bacterium]|nr:hypothetical protein [Acidobacteriota bacterium]
MIDPNEVREILKLYAKHGWVLRRVLLSRPSSEALGETSNSLFGSVSVVTDDFDGLWFSRVSQPGSESWELRRLGGTPYALVTVLSDVEIDETREDALDSVARRMKATFARGS